MKPSSWSPSCSAKRLCAVECAFVRCNSCGAKARRRCTRGHCSSKRRTQAPKPLRSLSRWCPRLRRSGAGSSQQGHSRRQIGRPKREMAIRLAALRARLRPRRRPLRAVIRHQARQSSDLKCNRRHAVFH